MLIGIDIGGTKCAVCTGESGEMAHTRRTFPTPATPEESLDALLCAARELAANSSSPPAAIGISCGGPLDARAGVILSPPNLPGWDHIPVARFFSDKLGVPAFLQNDANACAMAEWMHGAGRGAHNMMFCTMGTGFGCGLILGGRLHEGANGNGGELGHVRLAPDGPVGYGKAGSVEGFCGGNGIAQLARLRTGCDYDARQLAEAARMGDTEAQAVWNEVGTMLGRTLAIAIDFLNLDRIVIGSIFERSEDLLRPSMERAMKAECLPAAHAACQIRPSALGDHLGDIAALTIAQAGLKTVSTMTAPS